MSAGKGADIEVLQEELKRLDERYKLEKIIGAGSYGVVLKGVDTTTNESVAVKKISKVIFQDTRLAKRILREVKLLAHFHKNIVGEHRADNIIGLQNLITPDTEDFKEFWIVMELAESDLKSVFKSGQTLSLAQIQYMLYQILHGLKTIKASGVIHRDITPANILVNYQDLNIKICDFGLAREEPKEDAPYMTDYVTMRWYRAPELVMESKIYNEAVDMWGVGCILAEMFGSKPLFRGVDRINQLDKIIEIVGSPELEDVPPGSEAAQKYVRERYIGPNCKKGMKARCDWAKRFETIATDPQGDKALHLLDKLLVFNPAKRLPVEQALEHPFLADLHDPEDEDTSDVPVFDFSDSDLKTISSVKNVIYAETLDFHRRNPKTMTKELKARLQLGSLQESNANLRTGFEGTIDPKEVEDEASYPSAALPKEVDLLVDMLSNLGDEHRAASMASAAEPLHMAISEVVKSGNGNVVIAILKKYGWEGERFVKELPKAHLRQLIKDIRDAFCLR